MIDALILIAIVVAIVGVAVYCGKDGETSGKAGNSSMWP